MIREIILEGRKFTYELVCKNVKNINLRIKPDGKIFVSANITVKPEYIDAFIRKNSAGIINTLNRFENIRALSAMDSKKSIDGETIYFLGEALTVNVQKAASNIAFKDGSSLVVYSVSGLDEKVREIIDAWYDSQCRKYFNEIGQRVYKVFSDYVDKYPKFSYKQMKTLWGSCNPVSSRISINKELIKYDIKLIEFVFYHEFTHFIHRDHSPAFYRFMSSVLPDHAQRKEQLCRDSAKIKGSMA